MNQNENRWKPILEYFNIKSLNLLNEKLQKEQP